MNHSLDIFLRLLISLVFGGLVGLEREHNNKDAGLRTHALVALSSALLTIISKEGFLIAATGEPGADLARIAASIIPGIGFIGAGSIFIKGNRINGLTTAAGIVTSAAIGMAFGCGLFEIGGMSGALILITLWGSHLRDRAQRVKAKNTRNQFLDSDVSSNEL